MDDDSGKRLMLPQEIERYIASLLQIYKRQNQDLLQRLIVNAEINIEEHSYDNWDGGCSAPR